MSGPKRSVFFGLDQLNSVDAIFLYRHLSKHLLNFHLLFVSPFHHAFLEINQLRISRSSFHRLQLYWVTWIAASQRGFLQLIPHSQSCRFCTGDSWILVSEDQRHWTLIWNSTFFSRESVSDVYLAMLIITKVHLVRATIQQPTWHWMHMLVTGRSVSGGVWWNRGGSTNARYNHEPNQTYSHGDIQFWQTCIRSWKFSTCETHCGK